MKIEVKKLQTYPRLSDETTAYNAVIYVDGFPTLSAENGGYGGPDSFHELQTAKVSQKEIEAWLAVNEPPRGPFEDDPKQRADYDSGDLCDLEDFVGRAISDIEFAKERTRIRKSYERALVNKICEVRDGAFWTYKAPPTADHLAKLRASKPDIVLLNDADAETKEMGLKVFCPNLDDDDGGDRREAVYARLRESRLTPADARWLLMPERSAEPTHVEVDRAMLERVAEEGEAKAQAYTDGMSARHAAARNG